jgi:hypothetical protein
MRIRQNDAESARPGSGSTQHPLLQCSKVEAVRQEAFYWALIIN